MTNKKADVKDGKMLSRAKPLRTQIKVQQGPTPARETPVDPKSPAHPKFRYARLTGDTQHRRVVPRSSKDEQSPPIEVKFDAPLTTLKKGEVVKVVGLNDLPAPERRVQVAAARLRVTLDERLDRLTPPEVQALAKEPL